MEKDTIITLDDNTNYALLDETNENEKKYFFAIKLDDNGNPTTDYEIFEEEIENEETYMYTLEEGPKKEEILIEFTKKYINKQEKETEN